MLYTHILGHRVASPGAATQGQRRNQLKVVKITYTAMGRRRICQNTAGLHSLRMLQNLLMLININIQRSRMSITAVSHQSLSLDQSLIKGLSLVHSQHWRKLLVGKLLTNVNRLNLSNNNLCIYRYIHAC